MYLFLLRESSLSGSHSVTEMVLRTGPSVCSVLVCSPGRTVGSKPVWGDTVDVNSNFYCFTSGTVTYVFSTSDSSHVIMEFSNYNNLASFY